MTELFRGAVSISPTKRRRFWWVAWWKTPPCAEPFATPDAFDGGARTRHEAKLAAELAAGTTLVEIEPKWARAWLRVREGRPPFPPEDTSKQPLAHDRERPISAREILGVGPMASDEEIKRAFRAAALVAHPDRGGDALAFIRLKKAYDSLRKRRPKHAKR